MPKISTLGTFYLCPSVPDRGTRQTPPPHHLSRTNTQAPVHHTHRCCSPACSLLRSPQRRRSSSAPPRRPASASACARPRAGPPALAPAAGPPALATAARQGRRVSFLLNAACAHHRRRLRSPPRQTACARPRARPPALAPAPDRLRCEHRRPTQRRSQPVCAAPATRSSSSEFEVTSRKKSPRATRSSSASLDLHLNDPLPLDWEQCLDLHGQNVISKFSSEAIYMQKTETYLLKSIGLLVKKREQWTKFHWCCKILGRNYYV
ncbi:serine/arginine-rich splicing factor SR45-like [Panicum virgatum]|uniref:serine/arginine-rich splicing factor SR45-like n=1 Tax=Panicum virgatum TaxID=38727 RepID=UPI0019D52731|nr:serine/arginine-rich splicing factor SR45-like [Panicum virgatum]